MRVLAVDDDEVSLDLLQHALTEAGYEVETACDGQQAMEILRKDSARLVVSDWMMPRMAALALCRQIRKELPRYVYVILLTSRDEIRDVVQGLTAGADDFLTKPFAPAELLVRLRAGERILALETREVTIFALAKLVESRDPETGVHLERIRGYARLLAQQLANQGDHPEVDEEYVQLIYLTSPLHDIGKIGIPDCILLKPGRLCDREFEIMKTHTTIGAETLEAALEQYPCVPFLRMARDIAQSHHERFDGGGYPAGLKGLAIPLCGRIVALADVYDALTSKRVYKEAFTHDVARSIILAEEGKQFDPQIVAAFRCVEEEVYAIQRNFSDLELSPA